eukprot:4462986-Pleurochrysis_carterae.AAC.5
MRAFRTPLRTATSTLCWKAAPVRCNFAVTEASCCLSVEISAAARQAAPWSKVAMVGNERLRIGARHTNWRDRSGNLRPPPSMTSRTVSKGLVLIPPTARGKSSPFPPRRPPSSIPPRSPL